VKCLDLFSGIGGFSLGLERAGAFRTVAFCEREPFCQAVLRKHWPATPIYDDVRTIPTDRLGRIDLICGGFPCQPWSVAGQQRGAEDDRDLWPEMARLIAELQPTYVIGENVRGFINEPMGLQRSLSDLESLGYKAVPFVIPACAVDAPHRRDRVWIVANSDNAIGRRGKERRQGWYGRSELHGAERLVAHANRSGQSASAGRGQDNRNEARDDFGRRGEDVADANETRREQQRRVKSVPAQYEAVERGSRWLAEPGVGRVAHGVPRRVDRLKALGNAVVPQVVEQIGRAIMEVDL
jgi:DNA (cytosine-5)-methyltransferase 1